MNTTENITPLPWCAENCGSHVSLHRQGWPRDAWQVASFSTQAQDKANAEYMAMAANSFPVMLAALQDIAESHDRPENDKVAREALEKVMALGAKIAPGLVGSTL